MKSLKTFFITLLMSLSTVFLLYPKIVFADNRESIASTGGCNFPLLFILAIISAMVMAFIVYILGRIINRKWKYISLG